MSALPPLDPSDFAAFFRAVHGHDPFPWQKRLSRQVSEGEWPRVLDLPTGTGKTAALDVAVFALALDAGRNPRTAPLRIIYVVDRRTIVDQAYERSRTIQRALIDANDDVVRHVRDRLTAYGHDGVPLRKALLRGGVARDDLWARTPDQPLIAVSTVDQVGSRLLFRGYGVSDSMKPVHAGLLGSDVLYLLDEVHLSQSFRETLEAIQSRYRTWAERPLKCPFVVVEMSATPGGTPLDSFRLDDADRHDPILLARLRSSKPVSLRSTNARGFIKELGELVVSMLDRPGATIAAVVNRVKAARDLHESLRERFDEVVPGGSSGVHLLTGRMRPFDRDAIEGGLRKRIQASRTRSASDQPIVIVATQSIEAGADFDFDDLVTECASLDALRQRFGRLDRLGELAGSSRGVVVARTDSLKDDPVYGDAIGKTWDWLRAGASGHVVDFGIDALVVPQDAGELGLLAPKEHAPILLPSHLDAWVQTAPIPVPDPEVALWLHGPRRGLADVQVVWRADLTGELLEQATSSAKDVAEATAQVVLSIVEALPPVSAEAMSVPFLAAKRWLQGLSEPESFDVEGAVDGDEDVLDRKPEAPPRAAVLWQGEQSGVIRVEDLRPGQTIVVPSSYGGIRHGNWAPESHDTVTDVAEFGALRHGRRPTLRLHEAVVPGIFGAEVGVPKPAASDSETLTDREIVIGWMKAREAEGPAGASLELLQGLLRYEKSLRVERLPLGPAANAGEYFLVVGKRGPTVSDEDTAVDERVTTEDSSSSFTGIEVTLSRHLSGVAEIVSGFAQRVGLPQELIADLRLAAEWHDAGKADQRFQRWLHGGGEFKALVQAEPLAKGSARISSRLARRVARERAGYPAGGRHELMSLVLMESAGNALIEGAHDWTFVRHAVASHHGHCRPLAPWVQDPEPVDVVFSRNGLICSGSSAHDFVRLDSGIAERFWQMVRTYGWWGSAWLEAMVRLADHRQSEREQSPGWNPHA